MFFVMYFYEDKYALATSKSFDSEKAAQKYADGVHPEYKAFVVSAVGL